VPANSSNPSIPGTTGWSQLPVASTTAEAGAPCHLVRTRHCRLPSSRQAVTFAPVRSAAGCRSRPPRRADSPGSPAAGSTAETSPAAGRRSTSRSDRHVTRRAGIGCCTARYHPAAARASNSVTSQTVPAQLDRGGDAPATGPHNDHTSAESDVRASRFRVVTLRSRLRCHSLIGVLRHSSPIFGALSRRPASSLGPGDSGGWPRAGNYRGAVTGLGPVRLGRPRELGTISMASARPTRPRPGRAGLPNRPEPGPDLVEPSRRGGPACPRRYSLVPTRGLRLGKTSVEDDTVDQESTSVGRSGEEIAVVRIGPGSCGFAVAPK